MIYMVPLIPPPLPPDSSGAHGVNVSVRGRPAGIKNGKGKTVQAGIIICWVRGTPAGQVVPVVSVIA
jgi:ribosomal protein L27